MGIFDHLMFRYTGSDISTLVNEALMRPVKELQLATHFKAMKKYENLCESLRSEVATPREIEEGEEQDVVWVPCLDDQNLDGAKKLNLVEVSDRELYVRKANIVRLNERLF
jgi:SpoVK/Ycf46/Vps4 family AAA+-type ATPase